MHVEYRREFPVLGSKQFITYTEDVCDLFKRHDLTHHQYTDELQTIGHGPANSVRDIASTVHDCIIDVQSWCSSKRRQAGDHVVQYDYQSQTSHC
jgi:hypothetical protein